MSCAVIIPARAGSKGIPQKNIQALAGLPLIAHVINAAQSAKLVDRVVVSTDGDEIAEIAAGHGADVIRRPEGISGDLSSSEDAVLHALDELESRGTLPDLTCFAQCTSPLTANEDFDAAITLMEKESYDSLFAATLFHHFIWKRGEDGGMEGINHNPALPRQMRQEKMPEYLEAGAFYLFDTKGFREHKSRFFGRTGVYEMPPSRVFEIDTPDDLAQAEILLAQKT